MEIGTNIANISAVYSSELLNCIVVNLQLLIAYIIRLVLYTVPMKWTYENMGWPDLMARVWLFLLSPRPPQPAKKADCNISVKFNVNDYNFRDFLYIVLLVKGQNVLTSGLYSWLQPWEPQMVLLWRTVMCSWKISPSSRMTFPLHTRSLQTTNKKEKSILYDLAQYQV